MLLRCLALLIGLRFQLLEPRTHRSRFRENVRSARLDRLERILLRVERARLSLELADLAKLVLDLRHEEVEAVHLADEKILLETLALAIRPSRPE